MAEKQNTATLELQYGVQPGVKPAGQNAREVWRAAFEGDDLERWAFQDCLAFAVAANELVGWPIFVLADHAGAAFHAMVISSEGSFTDVAGPVPLSDVSERYATEISAKLIDRKAIEVLGWLDTDAVEDAKKVLRELVGHPVYEALQLRSAR